MHDGTTCGIANKGFSSLRNSAIRFSFCNGGQERSPQSLTSHTTGTLATSGFDILHKIKSIIVSVFGNIFVDLYKND